MLKIGPIGVWELLLLFVTVGLPLWAIIAAARNVHLSVTARILLIGIAVLAPVIGPIAVLIAIPMLAKRQAV
jgi:hypothetical protein